MRALTQRIAVLRFDGGSPVIPCKRDWYRFSRITSAVIAVAIVDKVLDEYDPLSRLLGEQARWAFGPICYVLRDVVALRTPVPCRGWQGFWTLPDDVERGVRAQLPRAA